MPLILSHRASIQFGENGLSKHNASLTEMVSKKQLHNRFPHVIFFEQKMQSVFTAWLRTLSDFFNTHENCKSPASFLRVSQACGECSLLQAGALARLPWN